MKDWLCYFFGCFFSHRKARQGANRSLMNGVLGLFLAVILMVTLMCAGYRLALPTQLSDAEVFLAFAENAFQNLEVTVREETLISDAAINSYESPSELAINGYQLVVDLRELEKLYDDFTVEAVGTDGGTISYEEYCGLSESVKANYTTQIHYSGAVLDVDDPQRQQEFLDYLNSNAKYDPELASQIEAMDVQDASYGEELYLLYLETRYPDLELTDGYGQAPTLQGYYSDSAQSDTDGKYLMLFRKWCVASFESGGKAVSMTGYYTDLEGYTAADGAVAFFRTAFDASLPLTVLMYIMNVSMALPLILLLWVVLALIFFALCRFRKIESGYHFFGAAQIIGSFLTLSGGISAVISLVAAFFLTQEAAYSVGVVAFYSLLALRSIVFILLELLGLCPEDENEG